MALLTIADINERNRQFWQVESDLLIKRIADGFLYEVARTDVCSEILRQVPIKSRKSIGQALADAEKMRHFYQSAFARKGGKAFKGDALQSVIEEIVLKNPTLTIRQLCFRLKDQIGQGTVTSIDKESDVRADEPRMIHFEEDNGKRMLASLSGLKDRLFRAKKKIKSLPPR
jgi:hypothetical protein